MKLIQLTTLGNNRAYVVPTQISHFVTFNVGGSQFTRVFFVRYNDNYHIEVMETPNEIAQQFLSVPA